MSQQPLPDVPSCATDGEPISTNATVAALVDQVADLLEAQAANPIRVGFYRRAAAALRARARPVAELLASEGVTAVAAVVGHRLAGAIAEIVATGWLGLLGALRGEIYPDSLAGMESGMGTRLARRVQETLGIVTITELEIAARDGRLVNVRGFGARRVRAIHDRLVERLGRHGRGRVGITPVVRVSVDEMLEVDGEYREEVAAGRLPRIAPRGGDGQVSLPILHTVRGERQYTAIVAPSPLTREPGTTGDWVLLHVEDPLGARQATVVTETVGALAGHRVVRGREQEGHAPNGCPRRRSYAVR